MIEFYDLKTVALHNLDFFKEQFLLVDLERQERINACKKQEEKIELHGRAVSGCGTVRGGYPQFLHIGFEIHGSQCRIDQRQEEHRRKIGNDQAR